jgi:hypothetical protein
MKPAQANLINAIVLIAMGLWGYFGAEAGQRSATALIPVAFGLIFALVTPAMRRENRVVAHIVVVLTLLLIIALFMPLSGAIERNDSLGILRISLMLLTSFLAMISFVRSFIQARKQRSS